MSIISTTEDDLRHEQPSRLGRDKEGRTAVAAPSAIFVIGCPRSGTTMMGKYLGSSSQVCDLGEFAGFYFATRVARRELAGLPSVFKAQYLSDLRRHARLFAESMATQHGCRYYLDHTPWNLLIAQDLLAEVPGLAFVLMVREPLGVARSLARSFQHGYHWAGADLASRIELWQTFNHHSLQLPAERTIAISYDDLCETPHKTLGLLHQRLRALGISAAPFDLSVLAVSHATDPGDQRPTLAHRDGRDQIALQALAPEDDDGTASQVARLTASIRAALAAKFSLGHLN